MALPPDSLNAPVPLRLPPGRAEKPVSLVPLPFRYQPSLLFILVPATTDPPKKSVNFFHSASVATCQPAGANPLESFTAYQLSLIHISEPTRLGMISYA